MPADDVAQAPRSLRVVRKNPFASSFENNPLTSVESMKLVPVPTELVETHEPRKSRRSYLVPGGAGGGGLDLSELVKGLRGKRQPVHERAPAAADEDDAPPAANAAPPRYGRR